MRVLRRRPETLLILWSHYAMIVWRGTYEGQSYARRRFRNPCYNAAVRRLVRVKMRAREKWNLRSCR